MYPPSHLANQMVTPFIRLWYHGLVDEGRQDEQQRDNWQALGIRTDV